ncbi:MAG: restriction endonuclease subunit S, partial [Methanothrix sp.]
MQKNENRSGYKKTKVGWVPEDWACVSLGEIFSECRTRGEPGLRVFSVTQDRGLVRRDQVDRRVASTLTSDECLLVEPGDFAYNMMRMWQGAVDLCTERGVVSPAYVVCRPRITSVFPPFMFRYFKSSRGLYKFWSYSYGLTNDRLRLYYKDFCHVPAPLPPLPEQEAIAGVLQCWDEGIKNLELRIVKKRNIKKGLMQALLSGKIRLPGFGPARSELGIENSECGIPEGWKEVRLGEMCSLCKEKYQPSEQEDLKCLELEHIEKETGRIVGYTSSSAQSSMKTRFKPGSVLFGKLRPYLQKFARPQFTGVCSTEIWVLIPNERKASGDFLFWLVQSRRFNAAATVTSGSKMPRADWHHLSSRVFCIPTIGEQQAIASFLSAADAEVEVLERK